MNKASFYIVLAGILWGVISLFVTGLTNAGLSSMQIVAVRVVLSALILFVYLALRHPRLLKIHFKHLPLFIGTGIFSIVFFNYCYFQSISEQGGAAVPALLLYTAPIFVAVLSRIFFHELLTGKKIMALGIAFVGLGFVTGAFGTGESLNAHALLLGLGSGLGYALYSIFGKFLLKYYESRTITLYTFVVASFGAIPLSGINEALTMIFKTDVLLLGLGLAALSTVAPFLFYTIGLTGVEAGKASVLATIEPLVAMGVGIIFFHEEMGIFKILGIFLVLSAILLLNMNTHRTKGDHNGHQQSRNRLL